MKTLICSLLGLSLMACAACAFADSSGTQTFGRYLVHYSALSTQLLNEQMAKQYSIERSPKRGLINLSVQKVAADETTSAVAATISGEATNLTGQKTPITIREIPDLYVSYIGLFDVVAPDTYTFALTIKPEGSDQILSLRFNKNFVAE
ncbi:MAG: DUF4426 domain-containing protein [Xanthomonadales bacterium]|nr:DUF4426 domain-containing protein [Xanthomonadales bacterium]